MDVKVGNGAFMDSAERAEELAGSIIGTAAAAGLKTHAVITDMNEVLGTTAGNAVEIAEVVRYLRNERREQRLDEVVLALCAEMLVVTGLEGDRDAARARCDDAVTSGRAAEIFGRMVAALGGPDDFLDRFERYLPQAPVVRPIHADGVLTTVDTRGVGNAVIELGGGRRQVGEELDHAVGFSGFAATGTTLDADTPLAIVHAASEGDANRAEEQLRAACTVSTDAVAERAVIRRIMDS